MNQADRSTTTPPRFELLHMLSPMMIFAMCACMVLSAAATFATPTPQFEKPATPRSAKDLVSVRVTSSAPAIGPGEAFYLVAEFKIEPEWHIYWKNPGETGAPTVIDVEAPPSYTIGAPIFARPMCIEAPDGVTYGYENRAVVAIPVTAPDNVSDGTVTINTDITYLVCKGLCMMGSATTSLDIVTAAAPKNLKASLQELGSELGVSFPQPLDTLDTLDKAEIAFDGTVLRLAFPAAEGAEIAFFPADSPGVRFEKPGIDFSGGRAHMMIPVELNPGNALGEPMRLAGLIALGKDQKDLCYEFDLPADVSDAPQGESPRK